MSPVKQNIVQTSYFMGKCSASSYSFVSNKDLTFPSGFDAKKEDLYGVKTQMITANNTMP